MNKVIPLIAFSILLLVPIGAQNAFAFSGNLNDAAFGSSVPFGVWIVVGDNGIILRSVDNGLTWAQIPSGTNVNLNSVDDRGDQPNL